MAGIGEDFRVRIYGNTAAGAVRAELYRITGKENWNDNKFWRSFLDGRRDIFDAICKEEKDNDWTQAVVADRVEKEFVKRVQKEWGQAPNYSWALEGGWLDKRTDIVEWIRSTYWKHNKERIKSFGGEASGSKP